MKQGPLVGILILVSSRKYKLLAAIEYVMGTYDQKPPWWTCNKILELVLSEEQASYPAPSYSDCCLEQPFQQGRTLGFGIGQSWI